VPDLIITSPGEGALVPRYKKDQLVVEGRLDSADSTATYEYRATLWAPKLTHETRPPDPNTNPYKSYDLGAPTVSENKFTFTFDIAKGNVDTRDRRLWHILVVEANLKVGGTSVRVDRVARGIRLRGSGDKPRREAVPKAGPPGIVIDYPLDGDTNVGAGTGSFYTGGTYDQSVDSQSASLSCPSPAGSYTGQYAPDQVTEDFALLVPGQGTVAANQRNVWTFLTVQATTGGATGSTTITIQVS
jgi:hypothetical protein